MRVCTGQCTAKPTIQSAYCSRRGRRAASTLAWPTAVGQLRVVREVLPFLVAMARRVGALLGLLCAFGAARQSPYEPAQEGWDFSIGTYWMQMDEDLCASSASRVGVPAPRRASRLAGRTAWTSSSSCASSCGSCRRRRCRCRNRRAAPTTSSARSSTTRAPAARQFRRSVSTRDAPSSDHRPKPFRNPLAPRSFAKYDLDETGEIEFDELREELVQDIMNPYMEYTKDKPMDNVVPKA